MLCLIKLPVRLFLIKLKMTSVVVVVRRRLALSNFNRVIATDLTGNRVSNLNCSN